MPKKWKQLLQYAGAAILVIIAVLAIFQFVGGSESMPDKTVSEDSFGREVLRLVNDERQKQGVPALKYDDAAEQVAQSKTWEMWDKKYLAHISPYTGTLSDQFSTWGGILLGQQAQSIGENIAWVENYMEGALTPEFFVKTWMNSEPHRANILNPEFTHMGAALYAKGQSAYGAQEFYTSVANP